MRRKAVLFDLDGTIINSEEGITSCVRYVLDYWGIEQPPQEDLLCFIGPPMREQFQKVFGFDREQAEASVLKFRERFDREGIFECELYPGVTDLIRGLKRKGFYVALASSKHEDACVRIIEHFGLAPHFDGIFGASRDGNVSTKKQVLDSLFERAGIDRGDAVLIGDTRYDVLGAREAGISCIGVSYGFGSGEELVEAGAVAVCGSAEEVERYLEAV